jgi:hypothetical protein
MSEQVKRDTKDVVDSVIGGDSKGLAHALARLANSSPSQFLTSTAQLLNTEQCDSVLVLGLQCTSDFYHADGRVFGSVYTAGGFFLKKANPSGVGLALDEVRAAVDKARGEHEELILKKVIELDVTFQELDRLLEGHSFADSKLKSLAHVDLIRGKALLWAALNPIGRDLKSQVAPGTATG